LGNLNLRSSKNRKVNYIVHYIIRDWKWWCQSII